VRLPSPTESAEHQGLEERRKKTGEALPTQGKKTNTAPQAIRERVQKKKERRRNHTNPAQRKILLEKRNSATDRRNPAVVQFEGGEKKEPQTSAVLFHVGETTGWEPSKVEGNWRVNAPGTSMAQKKNRGPAGEQQRKVSASVS